MELGVRVYEEVVPFALVDFVDYPDGGDPYFAGERSNVTVNGGVRWLFAESTALKAQAGRTLGDITATRFALQLAVGF